MKRLLALLCLAALTCLPCRAQSFLGAGLGYSQVGYSSGEGTGCTSYLTLQLSPYHALGTGWGLGANLGWSIMAGDGAFRYRNVTALLAGYRQWESDRFVFRLGAGPALRLRYCKVDGDLLSLITTLKVGAGLNPGVSCRLTPRCALFLSPVIEAFAYDPLAGYYTQGLPRRLSWACDLTFGLSFTL